MSQDNRNTIIFVVCAAAILIGYQILVLEPAARQRQQAVAQQKAAATQLQQDTVTAAASGLQPVGPDGKPRPLSLPRAQAKAASPRIAVETPALSGSVSLRGGRIDDLYLKAYRETVDRNSPPVELLRPEGAQNAWFADFGWAGATPAGLPTPTTLWTAQGGRLAPGAPVTLTYDNGAGLLFTRKISVDADFMFTVEDSVTNRSAAPVALAPYASIQRQGLPPVSASSAVVHEGAVGALGEEGKSDKYEDRLLKYAKWKKEGGDSYASDGGWIGITDKYWLAALIPASKERITGQYRVIQAGGVDIYDANFVGALKTVAPGATLAHSTRFFAGAKSVPVLQKYQTDFQIPRFDDAVDWGMFWFFTRPIFSLLDFFYRFMGNFGLAILALTVVVKVVFFPLANKSYESITKMKKVQPEVEALRKKYKDDPPKQQQEIMSLYKTERINPLTGCLPMLIQIPVFYALFKVLSVTIEMRHAPFVAWINDLSARDPTTMWNLFGLLPFNPATVPILGGLLDSYLHVGLLGIAYGVTMWLTTAMNPPAADPIQQKIFMWMPVIFTFTLAQVAVGLMVYWTWNNVLSILQQYVIMRRFKVDNPIDQIIGKLSGKKKAPG